MPTVFEVLKASGFTDEAINDLDRQALSGFQSVLSTAEQEHAQAEAARRANSAFYTESIAPALDGWGSEKANLEAQLAFYRTQNEAARSAGFIPQDAPGYQPRDGQGRYVAGAPGGTPGSPVYTGPSADDIDAKLGQGLSNVAWALQEHQRVTGQILPDPVDQLAREASMSRLSFRDYVSQKYDYPGKRAEMQRKQQEEHDSQIRKEAEQARDRVWAEKVGSNPDVRMPQSSRFADTQRAVRAGTLPDPLTLNEAQRRDATRSMIRQDLAEQQG